MIILRLSWMSIWNRRGTVLLTALGIAVSVMLLAGVNKIRTDMRTGFANTISDADLIVGARSGPVNLLLYSVFRLGDATANVSWTTYRKVAAHPQVAWPWAIRIAVIACWVPARTILPTIAMAVTVSW